MKCDDFYIFKVRVYASSYYLKKFHLGDKTAHRKQHETAKLANDFFWQFFLAATKYDMLYVYTKYGFSGKECAVEYLRDIDIIHKKGSEAWDVYLIPKSNTQLIHFVEEYLELNKITYKKVKKIRIFFNFYKLTNNNHFRSTSKSILSEWNKNL